MANRRNEVRDAAISLVKNLPPGSEVMISVFAEKSYLAKPFTPAETIDLSFLNRLKFDHHTALGDSLTVSEPYIIQFAHNARRAIVLITDGRDNASSHGVTDVRRAMLSPGSPFPYVLALVDLYAATPQTGLRVDELLSPARAHVIRSAEPGWTLKDANEISNCIASQYALTYTSTLKTRDNRLHKIEIKMPQADKRVKVETLEGYYIPAS
jgi:hypothetical protein